MDDLDIDVHNTRFIAGGNQRFNEEIFQKLKNNDPTVTSLALMWGDEELAPNVDWKAEKSCIENNTHLKALTLECRPRYRFNKRDVDNIGQFFKAVAGNNSIVYLSLEYFLDWHQSDPSDQAPLSKFQLNNNIRGLRVHLIGNKNAQGIISALQACEDSPLQQAYLGAINHVGMIESLRSHQHTRKITLSAGNQIIGHGIQFHWYATIRALSTTFLRHGGSNNLRELDLSETSIDDACATYLADILSRNTELKKLTMRSCHALTSAGWNVLSRCFRRNNSGITQLHLIDCRIDGESSASLAPAIASMTTLQSLDLRSPRRGTNTIRCHHSLLQNPNLEELCLSNCETTNDDIVAFAESLATNTALKHLDLDMVRGVDTDGWKAFARVALPNSLLEELNLIVLLDDETCTLFANLLAGNNTLKYLTLNAHGIKEVGMSAFTRLICNKSSINEILNSNHTLCIGGFIPNDLRSLSQYNQNGNKKEVARRKIIDFYFMEDETRIQEVFDLEIVMPHLISWLGRDHMGINLLRQVLAGMPSLFNSGTNVTESRNKRKRA